MSKEETLARVEVDLERGHTYLALQRLGSLAAHDPGDLHVRALRAAINRQVGNFSEAGRWGYLTEDVDPRNIAAFERTFKRPTHQLLALKVLRPQLAELGPVARARFELLIQRAREDRDSRETLSSIDTATTRAGWPERLLGIGCGTIVIAGVLVLFGLAAYGYIALFDLL